MLMILRTNASTPETEEDIVQNPWACLEATNVWNKPLQAPSTNSFCSGKLLNTNSTLFKIVSLLLTSRIQLKSYIKAPGKTDKEK